MLWKDEYETVVYSLNVYDSWKSIISAFSVKQDCIALINLLQLCYKIVIVFKVDIAALFIYWSADI